MDIQAFCLLILDARTCNAIDLRNADLLSHLHFQIEYGSTNEDPVGSHDFCWWPNRDVSFLVC